MESDRRTAFHSYDIDELLLLPKNNRFLEFKVYKTEEIGLLLHNWKTCSFTTNKGRGTIFEKFQLPMHPPLKFQKFQRGICQNSRNPSRSTTECYRKFCISVRPFKLIFYFLVIVPFSIPLASYCA